MIQFNLKEEYRNHPNDYKYGVIITNSEYSGYPLTIVDNVTNKRQIKTLLHLSQDVRQYLTLNLYDDMLYLNGRSNSEYRMFDYTKKEISKAEALVLLRRVFYKLQPNLQTRSLVGTTEKGIENDPNYYEGSYVLNDENVYTILKCRDTVQFFKGEKNYYPDFDSQEDLLGVEKIDFELYERSLEHQKIKRNISMFTNKLLDENQLIETTIRFNKLEKTLDDALDVNNHL